MELAHPAVVGSFGPPGRHTLLLYRPQFEDGEFKGTVYLGGGGEHFSELPALGLIPGHFATEVEAVFFDKAGPGGTGLDLFVLYSYHRNGSESDDGHACAVYRWRGDRFVSLPDVEKRIAGLATAAAVRKRLRSNVR